MLSGYLSVYRAIAYAHLTRDSASSTTFWEWTRRRRWWCSSTRVCLSGSTMICSTTSTSTCSVYMWDHFAFPIDIGIHLYCYCYYFILLFTLVTINFPENMSQKNFTLRRIQTASRYIGDVIVLLDHNVIVKLNHNALLFMSLKRLHNEKNFANVVFSVKMSYDKHKLSIIYLSCLTSCQSHFQYIFLSGQAKAAAKNPDFL